MVQALAISTPVLARAAPGNLELIRHQRTGLLFNTAEECVYLAKTNLHGTGPLPETLVCLLLLQPWLGRLSHLSPGVRVGRYDEAPEAHRKWQTICGSIPLGAHRIPCTRRGSMPSSGSLTRQSCRVPHNTVQPDATSALLMRLPRVQYLYSDLFIENDYLFVKSFLHRRHSYWSSWFRIT
jgi:hypothetical protein